MNNNSEIHEAALAFLESFEEVFEKDWAYSREMLGIWHAPSAKDEVASKTFTVEMGTFLNPTEDEESDNWGNRWTLLMRYRILKQLLETS